MHCHPFCSFLTHLQPPPTLSLGILELSHLWAFIHVGYCVPNARPLFCMQRREICDVIFNCFPGWTSIILTCSSFYTCLLSGSLFTGQFALTQWLSHTPEILLIFSLSLETPSWSISIATKSRILKITYWMNDGTTSKWGILNIKISHSNRPPQLLIYIQSLLCTSN